MLRVQALELALVNDLLVGIVSVHATKPQIGHHVLEVQILHQIGGLLQHGAQDVAVVGVAGEGARAQHQAMLV